jgi:hypothetical protein
MKTLFSAVVLIISLAQLGLSQVDQRWKSNDETRPNPPNIEPATMFALPTSPARTNSCLRFRTMEILYVTGIFGFAS